MLNFVQIWRTKFENKAMVFYEKDNQVLSNNYNSALYFIVFFHDMELTHVLIDLGYSLAIMHLSTLEEVGIS